MDIKSLEEKRIFILKRLRILKILSVLEAFIVCFLAFVFIKDALIAVILAIFVGIFFFRFVSKKLILSKKELEFNALSLFLRRFNGNFKKSILNEKNFVKLKLSQNLKEFKSQNCFCFKDFVIYDLSFIDEKGRFFCGILLDLKENSELEFKDEWLIYAKLKDKNFGLNHIYSVKNYYLIATLSSPFFIDLNKDLISNFKILEENLNLIKNKFSLKA